jgi:hypothetical protein
MNFEANFVTTRSRDEINLSLRNTNALRVVYYAREPRFSIRESDGPSIM